MAGGEPSNDELEPDPNAEQQWHEARRTDLAHAFGIIVPVPIHGPDQGGIWRYGFGPPYGWAREDLLAQFNAEMRALLASEAWPLIHAGLMTQEAIDAVTGRPYEVGPTAQGWPLFLYNLYQDARPFVNDGASLIAWGLFFRAMLNRVQWWAQSKEREALDIPEASDLTTSDRWVGFSANRCLLSPPSSRCAMVTWSSATVSVETSRSRRIPAALLATRRPITPVAWSRTCSASKWVVAASSTRWTPTAW